VVFIPQPPRTEAAGKGRGNFWKELLYGFEYIFARPSLLGLQLVFFTGNFLSVIGMTVLTPMILARTSDNSQILGAVQSAGAAGGVAGSLLLTAWGGPKKRIHGVLGGWALSGLANQLLMGLGGSLPFWLAASFMGSFIGPIINGSNQAIWQSKVAPDIQGRVFSIRRLIAQITAPLGMLLAGPLADQFFEPAMAGPDRLLGGVFGGIFSTGPGTGMSMMIAISGVLVIIAGLAAFTIPRVYHVETLLPDHQADSPT
jgi:DHA3 family macrolide efflux protein-like MFS transporter